MNAAERVEMIALACPELTHFGLESVTSRTYAANRARMFGTSRIFSKLSAKHLKSLVESSD
jgi:hypothetical protein